MSDRMIVLNGKVTFFMAWRIGRKFLAALGLLFYIGSVSPLGTDASVFAGADFGLPRTGLSKDSLVLLEGAGTPFRLATI